MDLEGKAAVVTGASSDEGVGTACAQILAGRGCRVVVNYATNRAGAEAVAASCQAAGADAIAVQGDVSKDEDCRRLVAAAVDRWGRLDVLVNNAAVTKTIPHRRLDLLDAEEFQRTFAVNLIGNYQMCRAAAPHLKASGDAAIVNISSVGAFRGAGSSIAYAASKGALNTMTISLARALAPEVRVNALCPGGLLGSWTRRIMTEEQYQARVRQAETEFPLRRGVWPIDVARAALFLIEHAVAMTGECIRMDAGEHLGGNLIKS
ncbi:MAG: SDR family oxidoreductase [Hyphomicrobiales bacterium]|nr:SDR family oxidoreductase [Hyphomicrobiales bacterium]